MIVCMSHFPFRTLPTRPLNQSVPPGSVIHSSTVLDATRCTLVFQPFDRHALGSCSHTNFCFRIPRPRPSAPRGVINLVLHISPTRPKLVAAYSTHRPPSTDRSPSRSCSSASPPLIPSLSLLFRAFSVHTFLCFSPPLYEISLLSCLNFLFSLHSFFRVRSPSRIL